MVKIRGTHLGFPVEITWRDGELSGTDWAVRMFRKLLIRREGHPVPIDLAGVDAISRDHLHHASSVAYLAREFLDEGGEVKGGFPVPPIDSESVPRDAIV